MMMMMAGKALRRQGPERNRLDGIGSRHFQAGIDNLLANQTDIGAVWGAAQDRASPEPGSPYPRARAPAPRAPVCPSAAPERPSKPVLSAAERRQLLEQHHNGSS